VKQSPDFGFRRDDDPITRLPDYPMLPPHPIVVVVDDIRSAFNVGSVFRTADAAGLAGVFVTGYSATPEHREVRKVSLGAEEHLDWHSEDDVMTLLARLREEGYTLAALERTPAAITPDAVEPAHFPMALVLGNEVTGVKPGVLEMADLVIGLPQYGHKTSLNVSVAFGIAAYGLVARWRQVTESADV
jgi:tRNA G18 (ribose-2'-O)-methylase SpoU